MIHSTITTYHLILTWDLENYLYATTGQYTYECDELDLDDDNDGVDDYLDPCQFSPWFHVDDTDWTLSEVDLDTDGDGCFNSEDDDDDGDSIPDNQDVRPIGLMSGAILMAMDAKMRKMMMSTGMDIQVIMRTTVAPQISMRTVFLQDLNGTTITTNNAMQLIPMTTTMEF